MPSPFERASLDKAVDPTLTRRERARAADTAHYALHNGLTGPDERTPDQRDADVTSAHRGRAAIDLVLSGNDPEEVLAALGLIEQPAPPEQTK